MRHPVQKDDFFKDEKSLITTTLDGFAKYRSFKGSFVSSFDREICWVLGFQQNF